jgi:hypothetical protein
MQDHGKRDANTHGDANFNAFLNEAEKHIEVLVDKLYKILCNK